MVCTPASHFSDGLHPFLSGPVTQVPSGCSADHCPKGSPPPTRRDVKYFIFLLQACDGYQRVIAKLWIRTGRSVEWPRATEMQQSPWLAFGTSAVMRLPSWDSSARKKHVTLLVLCVSSLRRGHANLLCIVPILTDDPRRESIINLSRFLWVR